MSFMCLIVMKLIQPFIRIPIHPLKDIKSECPKITEKGYYLSPLMLTMSKWEQLVASGDITIYRTLCALFHLSWLVNYAGATIGLVYMIYHNYKKFNQIQQKSPKGGNLHASDIHMADTVIKLCVTQNFLFYCSQITYWPFEDYVMTKYLTMYPSNPDIVATISI